MLVKPEECRPDRVTLLRVLMLRRLCRIVSSTGGIS